MTFYEEMQGVASEILAEFKQGTVQLVKLLRGEVNPNTPWIPDEPVQEFHDLDATVSTAYVENASAAYQDGSLIEMSDLIVTCAVPSVPVSLADSITIDGKAHAIKQINVIPSAGTPVAFKIFVRS
jgi:protoporphyrinogen oxidase